MEISSSSGLFNPWDKEIFIPDNRSPFGNCIPVRLNQAILLFHLLLRFDEFLFYFKWFLNGSCGYQISKWAMWKSNFCSLVQNNDFTIFWKGIRIYQLLSLIWTHTGIYIFDGFFDNFGPTLICTLIGVSMKALMQWRYAKVTSRPQIRLQQSPSF